MTISPETRAELRRLHAAYEAAWKPGEIIAEFDDVAELAVENLLPLLDALEAAERELAHREAQLKLTQEHLVRAQETIKRMEDEAWKAAAASELLRGALKEEAVAEWMRQRAEEAAAIEAGPASTSSAVTHCENCGATDGEGCGQCPPRAKPDTALGEQP